MINLADKSNCCGCSACSSVCPLDCISMVTDQEGFFYPRVDTSLCVNCNRCERACPFLSSSVGARVVSSYAAKSRNVELLHASSSGGIFTELCRPVIESGGVVYGVTMDAGCRSCSFSRAEDMDEVARMRGSKYLQADACGIYKRVAADLKEGRQVLFCGTPCQANALTSFLGEAREGLLLVDCVCHGVPSPGLWAAFIDDLESSRGRRVKSVSFRCKEVSWQQLGIEDRLGDELLFEPADESPYMRMFTTNLCLRPSCYACKAKTIRFADLTIADFWGIEDVAPQMADRLGCSLVIVRSDTGSRALKGISEALEMLEVTYEDGVRGNPYEHSSVEKPSERDDFFADLYALGYSGVVRKYCASSFGSGVKRLVKESLSKVGVLGFAKKLLGRSPLSGMRYGILVTFEDADPVVDTSRL